MVSKTKHNEPIKTILVITIGFLLIYILTKWQFSLYISFSIGIIGLFSTYLAQKIDFLWMKLTWLLSKIVPNILLTLFYFFFLTPIAILSRVFGKKDPLHLINNSNSVFKSDNKTITKSSFEKPW